MYINNSVTYGVQNISKSPSEGGGKFTIGEIQSLVQQSLSQFNESTGSAVRPYFVGTTNSTTVYGALVVRANPTPTDANGYGDVVSTCSGSFPGMAIGGYAEFNVKTLTGGDRLFQSYDTSSDTSSVDIVSLFHHELGHALGLAHPPNLYTTPSQIPYVPKSVMTANTAWGRHYTKYDVETYRFLYTPRNVTPQERVSGASENYGSWWSPISFIGSFSPAFRPGHLSEGSTAIALAGQPYDATTIGVLRTATGGTNAVFPATPIAPVSHGATSTSYQRIGGAEYRSFYLESDPPSTFNLETYTHNNNQKRICWYTSANGVSWSYSGCIPGITTFTDHVVSTFDPTARVWILTWVDDQYWINVMSMPGAGSAQTVNVHSTLPYRAWHAPSVSCGNSSMKCAMVQCIAVHLLAC